MGMPRLRTLAAFILALCMTLPVAAATVSVGAGGNLQLAIDNAAPGDTILLQAGATFTGNFVVRGTKQSLTIRSSAADSLLPSPGQRTGPEYAPYLPKLKSPNSGSALTIEPGASYITLVHLEVLAAADGSSNLIELGYVDSRQTTAAQAPHHLVLDRLLVTVPSTVAQKRGIALNSASTQVLGCYLAGLKFAGADAQAIAGWNGPGPFVIENNYLEGAGENLMFGGSDPTIPNLVPTNIQIRRNYFSKPLAWKGTTWTVKNILELKNAQDVVIEGNILEYNWSAAQPGYSVLFTPRNQYGGNPETVVQRVLFVNNKVRHVSSVFNILGRDTNFPSQLTNDIEIRNNVFEDVSKTFGGVGRMLIIDGADNIRFFNNTSFNTGTAIYATGHAVTGFRLENNIFNYGDYGIMGDGASPGNGALTTWFPGAVVLGNVVPNNPQPWTFPVGNSYPANWTAVAFVDLAGGNYRLSALSPYRAAGTGGSTPGANIDTLEGALTALTAAPVCAFTVTPLSHSSPATGDSFSVSVTASRVFVDACSFEPAK
jgi:predicted outer membrane repeat protein